MLGKCCIRSYSKTQNTIAQSSAESELIGTVKAATEALGIISLGKDLGIYLQARLHVDASAAIGILDRRGVGRVRHLDVGMLWMQEQRLRRVLDLQKVLGTANPADLMTKHLGQDAMNRYCETIGLKFLGGRADKAVELNVVRNREGLACASG